MTLRKWKVQKFHFQIFWTYHILELKVHEKPVAMLKVDKKKARGQFIPQKKKSSINNAYSH